VFEEGQDALESKITERLTQIERSTTTLYQMNRQISAANLIQMKQNKRQQSLIERHQQSFAAEQMHQQSLAVPPANGAHELR